MTLSVFRRFYTNFIASLWQQGEIQKVEKEHIIIYNIKTEHKKRGKQTLKQTIIETL